MMIDAARNCIGTPFHHQGRTAGAGLDCIGLIVHAARVAGMDVEDCTDYGRNPDGIRLLQALNAHGFEKTEQIQAGNVLVFRFNRFPQHVALATTATAMVHAYAPMGSVVETTIGQSWLNRLTGIYRLNN